MIQFLPAIASLIGTGYGAIKEGQERRKMAAERQKWGAENEALFNKNYYSDYTKRADVQSLTSKMRDEMKKANDVDQNVAAVTGATPEAINMQKERRNKAMTNLYSNIGAMGAQYKERVQNRYQNNKQALQGLEYDTMSQEAESAGNIMNNGISGLANTDWATLINPEKSAQNQLWKYPMEAIKAKKTLLTVTGGTKIPTKIPV